MFIAVTGPESSGKTAMSDYLGERLPAIVVEEQARRFLTELERDYVIGDIIDIGRAQFTMVRKALDNAKGAVVSDTFMLELKVWTEVRFDGEPKIIQELRSSLKPDLYILCRPDIPWEPDALRENPLDRDKLFAMYKTAIQDSGVEYVEAYGKGPERMERVLGSIRSLIEKL